MKRFNFTVFILSLALVTSSVMAANFHKGGDIPITQEISDVDTATLTPYYIQSDGLGLYLFDFTTYKGKTTGTNSVLMANVCGNLPNGDRLLDTSLTSGDGRRVKITFSNANAILANDPNYRVPAQFFGIISNRFRNMNTCTCGTGQSMYSMAANTRIFCPMHFRLDGANYRLEMIGGDNETDSVQIVCNAADSAGCKEWTIDPISDPDYTDNAGRTRARLVDLGNNNANLGDYYMTFHLHATRP
jgi:hypothetical protein